MAFLARTPSRKLLLDRGQAVSLDHREWRAPNLSENIFEHVARTKEVRPHFEKANSGLYGIRISSRNALQCTAVPTRECELIIASVEFRTGLLPFLLLCGTAATMFERLVNARVKTRNLRRIAVNECARLMGIHDA